MAQPGSRPSLSAAVSLSDRIRLQVKVSEGPVNLPEEIGNCFLCRFCWRFSVHMPQWAYSVQSEAFEIDDVRFLNFHPLMSKRVFIA